MGSGNLGKEPCAAASKWPLSNSAFHARLPFLPCFGSVCRAVLLDIRSKQQYYPYPQQFAALIRPVPSVLNRTGEPRRGPQHSRVGCPLGKNEWRHLRTFHLHLLHLPISNQNPTTSCLPLQPEPSPLAPWRPNKPFLLESTRPDLFDIDTNSLLA